MYGGIGYRGEFVNRMGIGRENQIEIIVQSLSSVVVDVGGEVQKGLIP